MYVFEPARIYMRARASVCLCYFVCSGTSVCVPVTVAIMPAWLYACAKLSVSALAILTVSLKRCVGGHDRLPIRKVSLLS